MTPRKIILLSLALLIGIITFVVFRSMTTQQAKPETVVETTQVLAAARDLPTGTILREMDMKWIPWAATAENSKLYVKGKTEMTNLVGAVLREGLHTDEPILAGRVVQSHEQGFLAAVLSPGMRAMSVTLTPSGEVAGFIFPGDRVDVILTHRFIIKNEKGENDSIERALSETVITNVRVLALDQKSDNQSTDPKVAQLATLEVTPKQAEKLAIATDMAGTTAGHGSLSLVLRSLASDDPALNGSATPAEDAGADGPTMDSDVSPVFSKVIHTQKVHVMRGKDMTDSVFQRQR